MFIVIVAALLFVVGLIGVFLLLLWFVYTVINTTEVTKKKNVKLKQQLLMDAEDKRTMELWNRLNTTPINAEVANKNA